MGSNQLSSPDAIVIGSFQTAIADIVEHSTREEVRLLQNDGHALPERRFADLCDRYAVIKNLSPLDVIEAVDQVDDGGLACSCATHEGNLLSRLGVDVDVEEHLLLRHITEIHITEVNITLRVVEYPVSLVLLRLGIAQGKDTFGTY